MFFFWIIHKRVKYETYLTNHDFETQLEAKENADVSCQLHMDFAKAFFSAKLSFWPIWLSFSCFHDGCLEISFNYGRVSTDAKTSLSRLFALNY